MDEVKSFNCTDHAPAGKRFHNAVVRIPCPETVNGLSTANLGKPDLEKALRQHSKYNEVLKNCGLVVKVLGPDNRFPDSVFIEDVALCTPACAIISNPGAPTRRGEISGIRQVLQEFYTDIGEIVSPGTLEAGDVMMVSTHYFIGISGRTNTTGADQLIGILKSHGYSGSKVPLKMALHLKSCTSYIENNNMLVTGEFRDRKEFAGFNRIVVDDDEKYAANSLWINGKVLVPEGFPKTRSKIDKAGYETIVLDVSEFRKLDGGLSCLSLRF
jgi:dimethylargininase